MGAQGRLSGRSQRVLASILVVVLAAAVVATALPDYSGASPASLNAFAHGSLSQANGRANSAILGVRGLLPGHSTSGSVVITNTGDTGAFYLNTSNLLERAGSGGIQLSDKLVLTVADVTKPAQPITLYRGVISGMPPVALGAFQSSDTHTYELSVTFPDGGSADNALQGAQLSLQFDWSAVTE